MAKLNVVIPAVEVTVGNVTYRKVDRKAQAGDIVKALRPSADVSVGSFYEVKDVSGSPAFLDDGNDWRPALLRNNPEKFEVYAPISESAAPTITFQGAEWCKVDRAAHKGDAVKFTDENRASYLTEAELYVVNWIDSFGDARITNDDGDSYDTSGDAFEVYEKITEVSVDYREVKRKANVGERIRVIAIHPDSVKASNVTVGEEFTVKHVDRDGDILLVEEREFRGIISPSYHGLREYVVLEQVTVEPVKPERLGVGDYARVTTIDDIDGSTPVSYVNVGDIFEISEDDKTPVPYYGKRVTDGKTACFMAERLVRATDEEVAAAKDPRKQFVIGDYVKVTVEYCEHNVGDVLKITNRGGVHDFAVTNVTTNRCGFIYANKIVKLTAEEVAEIERKQAEEARWAAIGRKVNELKDGDIVRFTELTGAAGYNIGSITEIRNVRGQRFDFGGSFGGHAQWCELVTPVEQRFDRPEELDAA